MIAHLRTESEDRRKPKISILRNSIYCMRDRSTPKYCQLLYPRLGNIGLTIPCMTLYKNWCRIVNQMIFSSWLTTIIRWKRTLRSRKGCHKPIRLRYWTSPIWYSCNHKDFAIHQQPGNRLKETKLRYCGVILFYSSCTFLTMRLALFLINYKMLVWGMF